MYPNGSSRLGGIIPARAWLVNFTGDMPSDTGEWQGLIEMDLDVGGSVHVPLNYNLLETPPLVSFSNPPISSHHYSDVGVFAHAIDLGGGFDASGIVWNATTSGNTTFVGETLNGTLVNISNLSSFNQTLHQIWIATNLSEDGLKHEFSLQVTDVSGRTGSASHWIVHDDELPYLSVSSSVGELTNSSTATLHILAEEYSSTRLFATALASTGNGTGWNSTNSTGAPQWFNSSIEIVTEGMNTFSISSTDRAGRTSNLSIDITRDTIPPDIEITHAYSGIHNETIGVFKVVVENYAQWWLQNQSMTPYGPNSSQFHLVELDEGENIVSVTAQDAAGNWANDSAIIHIDSIYPILNWTSPVDGELLEHHLVDMTWENPGESPHMQYKLDSSGWISLPEMTSVIGRWIFELDEVGEHEICIRMWDDGRNEVAECRTVNLDVEIYTPVLYAPWNASLVNVSSLDATLYVGPGQTWRLDHHEEGASFVDDYGTGMGGEINLDFELVQGMNRFTVIVNGRGVSESFELEVEYDGIPPSIILDDSGEFRPDQVAGISSLTVSVEVSELGLLVECIDHLSPAQANITASELSFDLALDPWAGMDKVLLDGMKAAIRCTATDAAGNTASAWYNVTLDSLGPSGEVLLIEQSGRIFVHYTIEFQTDPVDYLIIIKQDNITMKTIEGEVDASTLFTQQFEVGASSPGNWTVNMAMQDDVGNTEWSNSTMVIEPDPTFADTLFSAPNLVNIGLGALIVILMGTLLFKSWKKDKWQ